ncbi:DNA-processing protein DprA [Candidatus Sneabacter namystus]|uniref:DNA-protecting protein DprA n=1 Tax=Candidatus Sneabacter namystus TaxID=2601646 RepID=A0A5C0UI54_9RICK|nr:DNA-processing protein DprA [Candidatus Sneabacter namystus]QEK39756.1 DNA-protecting protein DprA [Candidatus Sneabacter namystus]
MENSRSNRLISFLRLIRSENISPRTFFKLLEMFGSPEKALENLQNCARRGGKDEPIKICSKNEATDELESLEKEKAHIISFEDEDYPKLLLHLEDCPPLLTYKGNIKLAQKDCIAIVGSRNASLNAVNLTKHIAEDLSQSFNMCIISGMAKGIDTAAHQASIPNTIAILAGGVDNIYPLQNADLYNKIAEQGLIMSEMPLYSKPMTQNFPQRNRIIAGISLAVAAIEARYNSGSLITTRLALEQGKEVFAVPGFPLDPRSKGTNLLIKNGATIIENAQDIMDNLPRFTHIKNKMQERKTNKFFDQDNAQSTYEESTEETRSKILNTLSNIPFSADKISQHCNLSPKEMYLALLELELAGRIQRHPGNAFSLIL